MCHKTLARCPHPRSEEEICCAEWTLYLTCCDKSTIPSSDHLIQEAVIWRLCDFHNASYVFKQSEYTIFNAAASVDTYGTVNDSMIARPKERCDIFWREMARRAAGKEVEDVQPSSEEHMRKDVDAYEVSLKAFFSGGKKADKCAEDGQCWLRKYGWSLAK